jgi:acyl transferase domain-containing protein
MSRAVKRTGRQRRDREPDVAIVGMACLFPGAQGLEAYWHNLVHGIDAIVEPPEESWDVRVHYDPDSSENDRIYCKRGGYLGVLAEFDPLENGVLPLAVEGGEPEQWLALRVAREAIADAGFADGVPSPERTAVIIGKGDYVNRGNLSALQHHGFVDQALEVVRALNPDLTDEELTAIRADLKRNLPPFNADTVPALVPNIAAGRIANRLDLMGPSYTIDAACASSLIAVETASRELRAGRCDLALVGGIHVVLPMLIRQVFCQLGALSRVERIRPFDGSADGTILGEGIGMVVLQRLDDALAMRRRVYASVKGAGIASDGHGMSVMAPRLEGEILALRRAYESSGVSTGTIGLIEAHGTGTPVGDATEVRALKTVFGPRKTRFPGVALGSVKSMIGHLMPAAGMAALIKTSLALHRKVLPPTLNVEDPLEALLDDESSFYVNAEARPWIHGGRATPRRAGVNAFGFGGINVHLILEEHAGEESSPPGPRTTRWASEVFVISAGDHEGLLRRVDEVREQLPGASDTPLAELAREINIGRELGSVRLAVVATSADDLAQKLDHAAERLAKPGCAKIKNARRGIYFFSEPLGRDAKPAFLLPGEGSQYPWMLGELCRHFPEMRERFEITERSFVEAGVDELPSQHFFTPSLWTSEQKRDAESWLWSMRGAVTSVLSADYAMLGLMRRLGIEPGALVGHSTGEFPALIASGMIDLDQQERADRFASELHELFEKLDKAEVNLPAVSLVAVGGDLATVERLVAGSGGEIRVAMDNCPHQAVIAGAPKAVESAVETLRGRGLICETLPFDRPYHTPHFRAFADLLREFLDRWITRAPKVPTWTCATKTPFPQELEQIREIAVEQWMRPVAFRETVEAMYEDGVRVFVEVGARGNLSAFVDDILRGRAHATVAADLENKDGIEQLNHVVAQLFAHGVPIKLEALYEGLPAAPSTRPAARGTGAGAKRLETGWPELRISEETLSRIRERRERHRPDSEAAASPAPVEADRPQTPASRGTEATGRPATRPQVLAAHMSAMGRFLQLNQDVMQQYLERRGGGVGARPQESETARDRAGQGQSPAGSDSSRSATATAEPVSATAGSRTGAESDHPVVKAKHALVGTIVSHVPREEIVSVRHLDPKEEPFLALHTFGRRISRIDDGLIGMPVQPLTFSMETMAEVASLLVPGQPLRGMRDVRGFRWIAPGPQGSDLRVVARNLGGATQAEVSVQIFQESKSARADTGRDTPVIEGTVVFGPLGKAPRAGKTFFLRNERKARWAPGEIYEEVMFHEGALQGIASIDAMGDDGARATIRVLPRSGLFRSTAEPEFLADPVLLDQVGQVVGYWAKEYWEHEVVFPFYVEDLELYGPMLAEGSTVECRAKIEPSDDGQVVAQLEVVRGDGTLWARVRGWRDRRFEMPNHIRRFFLSPAERRIGRLDRGDGDAVSVRLGPADFSPTFFTAAGGMWRRSLARAVLDREEHTAWDSMQTRLPERVAWLMDRMAVKDAVREYLRRRSGLDLCPADIAVQVDPGGAVSLRGAWTAGIDELPSVTLRRDGVEAVATCC